MLEVSDYLFPAYSILSGFWNVMIVRDQKVLFLSGGYETREEAELSIPVLAYRLREGWPA